MRLFKVSWSSVRRLLILVGITFLFSLPGLLNLPGLMRCHGSVDSTAKNEYSQINSERIVEVGLAKSLN
jgi:hypothetical protein